MDLVTVTCLRDHKDMLRQAQSISLFLEPCTHWVIVNDENIDQEFWTNTLAPFYTKHTLKLLFPKWSTWSFNFIEKKLFKPRHPTGYKNQQVYKLMISQQINDDYLIIDSDTFFIKPTSIDEWADTMGSGRTMPFENIDLDMQQTIQLYADKLKCDVPQLMFDSCVPFVVKNSVMKSVRNLKSLVKWFNRVKRLPQSEFYLYNLLAYKLNLFDGNTVLDSNKSRLFFNREFSKFEDAPELKAILFKSQYFDDTERNRVNQFLLSKGITVLY